MIKHIEDIAVMPGVVITPCGSRVTCNPPVLDTDADYLVFVCPTFEKSANNCLSDLVKYFDQNGFIWEGSEHYQDMSENSFTSWRKDNINLIVTKNYNFCKNHINATALCKALNLLDKRDRVTVFQAILYGSFP